MLNSQIPARWLLRVNHPCRCFILGLSCTIAAVSSPRPMMRRQANMRVDQPAATCIIHPDPWSREIPVQLWFLPEVISSKMISTSENPESDFWICPETFLSMLPTYGQSSRHCAVRWDARWYQSMASQMLGSWKWSAAMETTFEWHGHPSESIRWVSQFSSFPLQVHRLWLVNHTDSFGSMNRMGSRVRL